MLVAWPDEALARVAPDHDTAVVVLTHDDKFDVPALSGALASDAFYVGALGSRRNQERRRERLLEAGVAEEDIERISGPSGLDVGAETPAETAVSILAEILAVRGRAGRRAPDGREGPDPRGTAGCLHRLVRRTPRDPDAVFPAAVRAAVEPAEDGLELEAGELDQPAPLGR